MTTTNHNIDPAEIDKFNALASSWWDEAGQSKPLHQLNPVRLDFIQQYCELNDKTVIDVGCGGGILTEALAKSGANAIGIDMSEMALNVAKLHALDAGLTIDYQQITVEETATNTPEGFDAVTCMEMLEHVPDPFSVIRACHDLVKPGGSVFFSTLNRHPKAYLLAVLGAEYVMNMLPKGTHDYARFIRPSELAAWCRQAGLSVNRVEGISYQPFSQQFSLTDDVNVNYVMHCYRQ